MIQLVLLLPLLFLLSRDDALCPFLGSCCKQMGTTSTPGDSFGGFPTIRVSPLEDSSTAALQSAMRIWLPYPTPQLPRGPHVFLRHFWKYEPFKVEAGH